MTTRRLMQLLPALAAIAGCADSLPPILCNEDGGCVQSSERKTFQSLVSRRVDLLFVVDDTPAMAAHLDAVAAGFTEMASSLRSLTGPTSVHAGFIRAGGCDTTTRGAACGLAVPDQYLRAEWCQTVTNLTSAYDETFACLGNLGAMDCGPAQPLSAALQFLTGPTRPGWEGFLRPVDYLMVIVVAAEDDASTGSVLEIAARLKALKADPSQVVVSVIGPGGCAPDEAQPSRLIEFANQFGANGLVVPLCGGQLGYALQRITESINSALQPPCFQNLRDGDPGTPGLQATCAVEDITPQPDGSWRRVVLASCDESTPPCWRVGPGTGSCGGSSFWIERGPDWCSEVASTDVVECLVNSSGGAAALP